MGVANVPAASAAGLQPKYQKFTSSGTFTLPTGYGVSKPLLVNIQVIGGGGGGSASRATSSGNLASINILGKYISYFGQGNTNNWTFNATTLTHPSDVDIVNTADGAGGGSGGIAQTQMYLTGNLTITVGAAGTRPAIQTGNLGLVSNIAGWGFQTGSGTINALQNESDGESVFTRAVVSANTHGGSGGTSTAGAVTATGGAGGTASWTLNRTSTATTINGRNNTNSTATYTLNGTLTDATINSTNSITGGTAGQPAGTAGLATPLLGAVAGGSGSSTSVKGAFGVGGIKTDGATHTGVEGTGGGFGSIGASGAVILTWWE